MKESDDNQARDSDIISQVLPANVNEFRRKILNYKPPKVDRYGDGFLAQAYLAAKNSETGSIASIRKELGLDNLTFQYYMDTYPDFAAAVKIGLYDNRNEKINELESALLSKALGVEVEEVRAEESTTYDKNGVELSSYTKKTTTTKQIPPDTQAILTLLQKIDPSYNPKKVVDINFNQTLNVEEDINVNVDYRELSTATIKELLASDKQYSNNQINRTPDGRSVRFLGEQGEQALQLRNEKREVYNAKKKQEKEDADKLKDKDVSVKKRTMSDETRRKISEALKNKKRKENI